MKRTWLALLAATILTVGCGGNPTTAPTAVTVPGSVNAQAQGGDYARFGTLSECSTTTYVGPIRLPISVHGTTAQLSWLGSDDAIRGYELAFERYDVTNVWVFAMRDVVTKPEAKEFLSTEGTYRVRVRGLFCNDGIGGWTDWVVFSTDDHNTPAPVVVIPPIDPPPPVDPPIVVPPIVTPPPPPPPPVVCQPNEHLVDGQCVHNGDGDGNGNGQGDDNGNGGGNGNGNGPPVVTPPVNDPPPSPVATTWYRTAGFNDKKNNGKEATQQCEQAGGSFSKGASAFECVSVNEPNGPWSH